MQSFHTGTPLTSAVATAFHSGCQLIRAVEGRDEKGHSRLEELFERWPETMTPIDGMEDLVRELKAAGYGCYVLSNASVRFEKYCPEKPVFALMDGLFVSAFYKMLKPDPAIYQRMCEEFSIDPEESIFIDDVAANIQGAESVGIRGIQFPTYDVPALRENLRRAGVRIF